MLSKIKERQQVTTVTNSMCQLKCVGKSACKDPVSTGHNGTGFRVSGMLTVFWTTRTLLWQAKSYYPTWESPVALLNPQPCSVSSVCEQRQPERSRESSSRFTLSVSSCVCQCWPEAFQCHLFRVFIHHTFLSSLFRRGWHLWFSKAPKTSSPFTDTAPASRWQNNHGQARHCNKCIAWFINLQSRIILRIVFLFLKLRDGFETQYLDVSTGAAAVAWTVKKHTQRSCWGSHHKWHHRREEWQIAGETRWDVTRKRTREMTKSDLHGDLMELMGYEKLSTLLNLVLGTPPETFLREPASSYSWNRSKVLYSHEVEKSFKNNQYIHLSLYRNQISD